MEKTNAKTIAPQEGFQMQFVRSNADVCFGGGVLNPQPLTSKILTPEGFVAVADLKAGDVICGLENPTQTIVHYELEGEKDCIRLVLDDGTSAESALDHKWWILKDGVERTAISFELLESYQISQEKGETYEVCTFRMIEGKPVPVRIKEVQDIGKKEVACIGVSNSDELYITDDYIITKNCGKAQPLNAKILTPTGWTTMGELKVGDVICDTEGGTQKVLAVYEKGRRPIYRVYVGDGCTCCCAEHLWEVYDNVTSTVQIIDTKELAHGTNHAKQYSIICPEPVYRKPHKKSPSIQPYMMGRIMAFGTIHKSDVSPNTWNKLRNMGVKRHFVLPDRYLYGTIKERKEVLRGFVDGMVKTPFDPGTKQLLCFEVPLHQMQCLRILVKSLGGKVIVGKKLISKRLVYIQMPCNDEYYSPNRDEASQHYWVMDDVWRVDRAGEAETRCILVSNENHLYITDNYITTHNTFAAILMVAEPTLDPAFRAAFTRRNLGNLKQGGGIIDDFTAAYDDYVRITTSENPRVVFPSGAYVDCLHIADESPGKLMERAKGWQYDLIYMDELTSYEWTTFSIIGTRCRGKGKWTGKIRGTTNPKRSHWTRRMLDFYIGPDGFVIPERNGVVIYYYQAGDTVNDLVIAESKLEVYQMCKVDIDKKLKRLGGKDWTYEDMIRSFVFYAGKMSENKASIGRNSSYIGSVAAVGGKRAQQLIEGNFNVDEDEADDAPIQSRHAQAVFTNDECRNGDKWITVDLADVGTDNLIALYWDGFHIEDILILTNSTPKLNYERIKLFSVQHDVPDSHIIYDATHGTYMYDYMPSAIPFISAGSAIGMYALAANRLKDECYMRLVDMITNGRISCSERVGRTRYVHQGIKEEYTVQSEFLEECSVVRLQETPSGKKKLMNKKDMNARLGKGRSMDLLDPCAMRMLPVLQYQYGEELDATSASRQKQEERASGRFNIYDDTNWA